MDFRDLEVRVNRSIDGDECVFSPEQVKKSTEVGMHQSSGQAAGELLVEGTRHLIHVHGITVRFAFIFLGTFHCVLKLFFQDSLAVLHRA